MQRDDDGAATPLLVGVKANAAVAEEHRKISVASILMVPEFVHKSLVFIYLSTCDLVGEEVCCSCSSADVTAMSSLDKYDIRVLTQIIGH